MPTRTELIPCKQCGTPRPLKVQGPFDIARAKERRCPNCVRSTFQPYTLNLECRGCGRPRPLWIDRPIALDLARARVCRECNLANLAHNETGNYPDVDELAVEHLIAGHPVRATPLERREAVAALTRRQLSASQIAKRIGCTQRTVERHRSRLAG